MQSFVKPVKKAETIPGYCYPLKNSQLLEAWLVSLITVDLLSLEEQENLL